MPAAARDRSPQLELPSPPSPRGCLFATMRGNATRPAYGCRCLQKCPIARGMSPLGFACDGTVSPVNDFTAFSNDSDSSLDPYRDMISRLGDYQVLDDGDDDPLLLKADG